MHVANEPFSRHGDQEDVQMNTVPLKKKSTFPKAQSSAYSVILTMIYSNGVFVLFPVAVIKYPDSFKEKGFVIWLMSPVYS